MKMFGGQLNALQQNTVCRVQVWQNAAGWIPPLLIAAKDGPKKANHGGRPRTVFQKFCHQPVPVSKILPSSLVHKAKNANSIL